MDKMNQTRRIEKLLEECEVVSFDLFDTLIKRDVGKPENVFALMEAYLKAEGDPQAENFYTGRICGMQAAYAKKNGEEIKLDDIYREIYIEDSEVRQRLLNVEKQIEIAVCVKNPFVCDFLDMCFTRGKRLFVITDTYLPKTVIWEIIKKNDLARYFEEEAVYVSSEVLKTKKSGSLYRFILDRESISPEKWLHIGDATRSDYLVPKTLGMHAIHIRRKTNTCVFHGKVDGAENKKEYALLDVYQSNRGNCCTSYYERFGYECLGPVVFGFCNWLKEHIEGKKKSKIWFLSREGQFLKAAYECAGGRQDNEYFFVSRQSVLKATFWMQDDIDSILNSVRFPHRFGREVLFDLLGLKYEDRHRKDVVYRSAADVMADMEVYSFLAECLDEIKILSRDQYNMLLSYMNLNESFDELVLVDIGWRGTMQDVLEQIIRTAGQNIPIHGYYIGINTAGAHTHGEGLKEGYLFDAQKQGNFIDENELFGFGGLFETLFMADHGSVMAYEKQEGKVVPILHECEYKKDYFKIKEIQNGALKYVRDASDSMVHRYLIRNMPTVVFAKIGEVGSHPKNREIRMLGDMQMLDGAVCNLVGTIPWRTPGSMRTELMKSGWKIAFLKKMCPLIPARQIYKIFRQNAQK